MVGTVDFQALLMTSLRWYSLEAGSVVEERLVLAASQNMVVLHVDVQAKVVELDIDGVLFVMEPVRVVQKNSNSVMVVTLIPESLAEEREVLASPGTFGMDQAHLHMDCLSVAFAGEHCSLAAARFEVHQGVADVVDIPYTHLALSSPRIREASHLHLDTVVGAVLLVALIVLDLPYLVAPVAYHRNRLQMEHTCSKNQN